MTTKEKIIQGLEEIPESKLEEVLNYVHQLKNDEQQLEEKAWQAYLKSEKEREEVYRRLANS
jgi:hypothetical protein